MARSDPALVLRLPSRMREGPARREPDEDRPRLRLVVTRGRLGVELADPFALGPLSVDELALSLPEVRFPVELSGGVAAFRHRRGRLEHVTVGIGVAAAQRWGTRRLRDVLGDPVVHHVAAPLEDGWLLGLATAERALAFEVLLAPAGDDLRLLPTAARGLGLAAPPQALAVEVLHALLRPYARVAGGAVVIERAAAHVARELMPLAGMRAPASADLRWTEVSFEVNRVSLRAERGAAAFEPTARLVRAVELAALTADAEEALLAGELDEARRAYLAALARAPRHPEIARRLSEVDRAVGERAEAALDTLSDAMAPIEAGALGAALLAATGERHAAQTAFVRAAEQEPYGPLAALCWLEAARLSGEPAALDAALDQAVARAPGLGAVRWRRLERHVRAGRVREVRADAEHLEAAATSAHERHDTARRTAELLHAEGLDEEAASFYERALRYLPDSVDAVAGLGRSLDALGRRLRALELLSRAVALAERKRQPAHAVRLAYAVLLAEAADDRPAAIAQVRAVPPSSSEVFEARLHEARWRAELGDLAGAGEALGRLAEAAEAAVGMLVGDPAARAASWDETGRWPRREDARAAIAQWLVEGSRIHEIDRGDEPGARRLAVLALRLAPQRATVQRAFRRFAEAPTLVPSAPSVAQASKQPSTPRTRVLAEPAPASLTLDADSGMEDAAADEALAEQLAERLRANPADEASAAALAAVLSRLGRDHELLALLSARIDEGRAAARDELVAQRREVLARLVARAEAAGMQAEAALYQSLLEQDA